MCCRFIYAGCRSTPVGICGRTRGGHTGGSPTHRTSRGFFCSGPRPPFSLRCLPFFYREKGSAVSCSLIDREVEFLCTHDEVALHCWVLLGKKPQITPRFKPTTQPSEGHEVRVTATGATGLAITARGVLTTRDYWARLLSALAHPLIDYTINTTCGITALVCVDEILL